MAFLHHFLPLIFKICIRAGILFTRLYVIRSLGNILLLMNPRTRLAGTGYQLLNSNGYASFSIGLQSVLDRIRVDSTSYDSVKILAPPDLALLGSPSSLLDKAVRLHILPKRLTYRELTSIPGGTLLKTLMYDEYLEIEGAPDFMSLIIKSAIDSMSDASLQQATQPINGRHLNPIENKKKKLTIHLETMEMTCLAMSPHHCE
ncbi:hypothetical protein K1719_034052 [Acacia pycnantha]|nr:hypothetical protein K1719_034052 [Acacia pycnantha]